MYLSDIVFIDEGNPKKIGHLINYFKCRSISAAIKKIQQYQQKAPSFQKVSSIQVTTPQTNEKCHTDKLRTPVHTCHP